MKSYTEYNSNNTNT